MLPQTVPGLRDDLVQALVLRQAVVFRPRACEIAFDRLRAPQQLRRKKPTFGTDRLEFTGAVSYDATALRVTAVTFVQSTLRAGPTSIDRARTPLPMQLPEVAGHEVVRNGPHVLQSTRSSCPIISGDLCAHRERTVAARHNECGLEPTSAAKRTSCNEIPHPLIPAARERTRSILAFSIDGEDVRN